MKKALLIFSGIILALGLATPALATGIGTGPCHHGNSNKTCRPDPQPSHGKDCLKHGKHGGENQDHCTPAPSISPSVSPSPSVQPSPSPSSGTHPVPTPKGSRGTGSSTPVGRDALAKTGIGSTIIDIILGWAAALLLLGFAAVIVGSIFDHTEKKGRD